MSLNSPVYAVPLKKIATAILPPALPIPFSLRYPLLAKVGEQSVKLWKATSGGAKHVYTAIKNHPWTKKVLLGTALLGGAALLIYVIYRELTKLPIEGKLTLVSKQVGLIGLDGRFNFSNQIRLADGTPFTLAQNDSYVRLEGNITRGQQLTRSITDGAYIYLPRSLFNHVQLDWLNRPYLSFQLNNHPVRIDLNRYNPAQLPNSRGLYHCFEDDIPPDRIFQMGNRNYEFTGKIIQLHPPAEMMPELSFQDVMINQENKGPYSPITYTSNKYNDEFILEVDPKHVSIKQIYLIRQPGENRLWLFIPHHPLKKSEHHGRFFVVPKLPLESSPCFQFHNGRLYLWLERPFKSLGSAGPLTYRYSYTRNAIPLDRSIPPSYEHEVVTEITPEGAKIRGLPINSNLKHFHAYFTESHKGYTLWLTTNGPIDDAQEFLLCRIDLPSKPAEPPMLTMDGQTLIVTYQVNPSDQVDMDVVDTSKPVLKLDNTLFEIPEYQLEQIHPLPEMETLPPFNVQDIQNQSLIRPFRKIDSKVKGEEYILDVDPAVGLASIYLALQKSLESNRLWLFIPHQVIQSDHHGRYFVLSGIRPDSTPCLQFFEGKLHLWLKRPPLPLMADPVFHNGPRVAFPLPEKKAVLLDRTIPPRSVFNFDVEKTGQGLELSWIGNRTFQIADLHLYYTHSYSNYTLWLTSTAETREQLEDREMISRSELLLNQIKLPARPVSVPVLTFEGKALKITYEMTAKAIPLPPGYRIPSENIRCPRDNYSSYFTESASQYVLYTIASSRGGQQTALVKKTELASRPVVTPWINFEGKDLILNYPQHLNAIPLDREVPPKTPYTVSIDMKDNGAKITNIEQLPVMSDLQLYYTQSQESYALWVTTTSNSKEELLAKIPLSGHPIATPRLKWGKKALIIDYHTGSTDSVD